MLTVIRGATAGPSERATGTFSGDAFRDRICGPDATDGIAIGNVFFAPCARTYWHSHEGGQILLITAGAGFVADEDGPVAVSAGDAVWTGPGVRHWHGAAAGRSMMHTAITIGGTDWFEPVSDGEYAQA